MADSKCGKEKIFNMLQWIRKLFAPCPKRRIRKATVVQLIDMNDAISSINKSGDRSSFHVYADVQEATPDERAGDSGSEYGFVVYSSAANEKNDLCCHKTESHTPGMDQVVPIADMEEIDKWLYNTYSHYSHVYEEITTGCQNYTMGDQWSNEHVAVKNFLDPCGETDFLGQPHQQGLNYRSTPSGT